MDLYNFYTGQEFEAYNYLGAHLKDNGVTFRTFAPNAVKIAVIGEFNNWSETMMSKVNDGNFYECHIKDAKPGMMYKYRIYKKDGKFIDHCDPYGYGMELRPNTASIIRDLNEYKFKDKKWMNTRSDCKDRPLNIYEVHLGSWKKKSEEEAGWYSYAELADKLIPYVRECGYNYIEVMPLSEHPCDESWGYQNTGFYSPTSRYGTAAGLMELIDKCHKHNIGVIMDFVPVHFAINDFALAQYDGTALYEYPHSDVGFSEWGSCNFMHSRGEVRSFLQSAANYWIDVYHFDGLRIDAVSNMIYWQGDSARGVNGNAIEFIKVMNKGLKERYPSIILAAEDSSTYSNVTKSVEEGGLGFDYKWDMGWMNDTLEYFKTDPCYRERDYHKLTFSMQYFYNERFLMPFSHDEVVHGKATILQKMNGDYEEKFPQAKALYMYTYAHPGKKLNFMGSEIGQLREWDEKREQDWSLLKYPKHDSFYRFMKDLNKIYLKHPALYKEDYEREGFKWLDCHQESRCIYVFERKTGTQKIIAIFNFSNKEQSNYELNMEGVNRIKLIIDSDMKKYGGNRKSDVRRYEKCPDGKISLDMPPFSARFYLTDSGLS